MEFSEFSESEGSAVPPAVDATPPASATGGVPPPVPSEDDEIECRVCRTADEDGKLYTPCKCDGSIRFVHQECLEMWLKHKNSGAETCELCGCEYTFKPKFADDAPKALSNFSLTVTLTNRIFMRGIPVLLRLVCVVLSWLLLVPLVTSWVFRVIVHSPLFVPDAGSYQSIKALLFNHIFGPKDIEGEVDSSSGSSSSSGSGSSNSTSAAALADMEAMKTFVVNELVCGILVSLLIVASTIILMSFLDFMRFQRMQGADGDEFLFVMDPPVPAANVNAAPNDANPGNNNAAAAAAVRGELPQRQWRFSGSGGRGRMDSNDSNEEEEEEEEGRELDSESEELSPWQFPEDWDYVAHDRDPALAAFKNADDFYAWFNQSSKKKKKTKKTTTGRRLGDDDEEDDEEDDEVGGIITPQVGGEDDDEYSDSDSESDKEEEAAAALAAAEEEEEEALRQEEREELEDELREEMMAMGELDPDDPDALPPGDVNFWGLLLDVTGIRGPLSTLVRNVCWLLFFNAVHLGLFSAVPTSLGAILLSAGRQVGRWSVGPDLWGELDPLDFFPDVTEKALMAVGAFIERVLLLSQSATTKSVDPSVVLNMFTGYLGLLLVVLLLRQIRSLYKLVRSQAPARASEVLLLVSNFVNVVSCVVKVGFLLFLRVFLTPTLLGIFVLYTYNIIAQYSGEEWTEFFCFNFIGGLTLTWALGICNMLVVTLSVMQLREVLHPDILAKFIRPQEPQTELLSSLMHESGLMHVRRLFVSLLVYLSFMAVFLYLPALLVAEQVSTIPAHIWRMRTWYGLPQLQVPLEISVVLGVFLTVLEHKKNIIGKLLHAWFKTTTSMLGLGRYLMPLQYEAVLLMPSHPHYHRYRNHTMFIVERSAMLRPPARWDSKMFSRSGRWAWGNEEPGAIELQVAPRVCVPSLRWVRIALLVAVSWIAVLVILALCTVFPLLYGRLLLRAMGMPAWTKHDVLAMILGIHEVLSYAQRLWLGLENWWRKLRDPCSGVSYGLAALKEFLVSAIIAAVVGYSYQLVLMDSRSPPHAGSVHFHMDSLVAGKFIVECLMFFISTGMRSAVLTWLGNGPESKSPFFEGTLGIPYPKFKRRLLAGVLYTLACPMLGLMVTLGLYWLWQERAMLSISMLHFAEAPAHEKYDVVALFILAARTIVVITAMRYAKAPVVEVCARAWQLFHDSAFSEKYLVGRELNNRADAAVPEAPSK